MRIQLPNRKNKPHNRPGTPSRGPTHTWGTPPGADVRPVSGSGKEASLLPAGPLRHHGRQRSMLDEGDLVQI